MAAGPCAEQSDGSPTRCRVRRTERMAKDQKRIKAFAGGEVYGDFWVPKAGCTPTNRFRKSDYLQDLEQKNTRRKPGAGQGEKQLTQACFPDTHSREF